MESNAEVDRKSKVSGANPVGEALRPQHGAVLVGYARHLFQKGKNRPAGAKRREEKRRAGSVKGVQTMVSETRMLAHEKENEHAQRDGGCQIKTRRDTKKAKQLR